MQTYHFKEVYHEKKIIYSDDCRYDNLIYDNAVICELGIKRWAAVMVYGNSPVIASFYDFVRNIGEIKNHKIHKPFFKTTFWVSVWGK